MIIYCGSIAMISSHTSKFIMSINSFVISIFVFPRHFVRRARLASRMATTRLAPEALRTIAMGKLVGRHVEFDK